MPDEGHVSRSPRGVPSQFHNRGRPTFYKGIKMRSRMEATAAALFDRFGASWEYEPMCFASEAGQYLPDFLVTGLIEDCLDDHCHADMAPVYVEIKPHGLIDKQVKQRMEIVWASDPTVGLLVLDPVEMVSWAAPYPDEFGRPWEPTETSAACWDTFPDGEDGDPFPGAMCGRLHIRLDPTALHNWWNPDAREPRK